MCRYAKKAASYINTGYDNTDQQSQEEQQLLLHEATNNKDEDDSGVTEDEVIEAAKQANAHNFIAEFPDGYVYQYIVYR